MNIRIPLLTITMLLLAGIAFAQDPQVNSADPAEAPQGTVGLAVEIAGDNFDSSASVKFLVSGSKKTGGITVTSVNVQGPNTIVAIIDVAMDATVSNFDIEVKQSRGRTGKGTELFAVHVNENQGQGANTAGIATFLTQEIPSSIGVFSDQVSAGNHQYVPPELGGTDCASVILPADDGVDQGKAQIFVRDPDGECAVGRRFLVRGSGFDLDGDGATDDELVERKLMCGNTFSKDTSIGDITIVNCILFIETIDEDNRVDRTGRIEWTVAYALHVSDDVRVVTAMDADIYAIVPSTKGNGNGRKEVVPLALQIMLPIKVEFHRVWY